MSNADPPKNRGWTRILAKGKQDLPLIRHPSRYSYIGMIIGYIGTYDYSILFCCWFIVSLSTWIWWTILEVISRNLHRLTKHRVVVCAVKIVNRTSTCCSVQFYLHICTLKCCQCSSLFQNQIVIYHFTTMIFISVLRREIFTLIPQLSPNILSIYQV